MIKKQDKSEMDDGRVARRRRATRAKLLEAAASLIASKGIDATTIQEITERADLGFGSFYNYFSSKEEIIQAVMGEMLDSFGVLAESLANTIKDPAELIAASVRHLVKHAIQDTTWGWLLVRASFTIAALQTGLGKRMMHNIEMGVKSGRFAVEDITTTAASLGGSLLSIVFGCINGNLGPGTPEVAAAVALQLLGLPPSEAREIAKRPLPQLHNP